MGCLNEFKRQKNIKVVASVAIPSSLVKKCYLILVVNTLSRINIHHKTLPHRVRCARRKSPHEISNDPLSSARVQLTVAIATGLSKFNLTNKTTTFRVANLR